MSKKKTRAQKIAMNKPKGKSSYAKKVERRRKLAAKLGMDILPLPLLKQEEE
jgi:hypothetical protein